MSVNVSSSQRDDDTKNLRLADVAERADVAEVSEGTDQRFIFAFFEKSLSFATRYKYDLKHENNSELFLNLENAPISFAVLKEEEGKLSIYVTGREKKVLEFGDKFVIERGNFGDADMPTRTVVVYEGEGVFIIGVEHDKDGKSLKVVKNGNRRILEENNSLQVNKVSDLVNETHDELVPVLNTNGGGGLPFAPTAVARPNPGFVEEDTVIDEFSPAERKLFDEIEKLKRLVAEQNAGKEVQNAGKEVQNAGKEVQNAEIEELKRIVAEQNAKIELQNAEIAEQGEKFNAMYSKIADSLSGLFGNVRSIFRRLKIDENEVVIPEDSDSKKEKAA